MPRIPRFAAPEVAEPVARAPIEGLRRACSCSRTRSLVGERESPSPAIDGTVIRAALGRIETILDSIGRSLGPLVGAR
jgi:hypothetical protein